MLRLDLTSSLQPPASSPQPQPLVTAAPAPGAPDSVMDTPEGVPTAQCWECSSSGGGGSSPIISRSGGQAQSSLCRHQVPSSPAQELGGSLWLSCRPSLSVRRQTLKPYARVDVLTSRHHLMFFLLNWSDFPEHLLTPWKVSAQSCPSVSWLLPSLLRENVPQSHPTVASVLLVAYFPEELWPPF